MIGVSLGSWAFVFEPYAENPIPLDRILQRLSRAEYDAIELSGVEPHVTLRRYATSHSRMELKRMIGDHGLSVSGYAADFSSLNPSIDGNKQDYLDLFRRNVELCEEIGSPAIRVDTVGSPGSIPERAHDAVMSRLADVWRDAAEIAGRAKVRVVWEFEPGFLFNKPFEIIALHSRVGHPNFQILFDSCHAYMCAIAGARQAGEKQTLPGGIPEFLKKLDGRIGAIHLIDSDGTLHHNETSTHRPFEEGYIDFRLLAPQLLDVEGVDWWCVDLCFWEGAWDLIESSRDFILALLDDKVAA
jgi:sugar phosphate isomerase/epimerase